MTRALIVQLFEYGLKPSIGRVTLVGLEGAVRGPEDPTALSGLEVVAGGSKVRAIGVPIFPVSLTKISSPRMMTMLLIPEDHVQNPRNAHCFELRGGLPSVLNRADRKTLKSNDGALPRIAVLKQCVKLGDNHCLQDVHSVGDDCSPPCLAAGFYDPCLDNLQNGEAGPHGVFLVSSRRDPVADPGGELRNFLHGGCHQEGWRGVTQLEQSP